MGRSCHTASKGSFKQTIELCNLHSRSQYNLFAMDSKDSHWHAASTHESQQENYWQILVGQEAWHRVTQRRFFESWGNSSRGRLALISSPILLTHFGYTLAVRFERLQKNGLISMAGRKLNQLRLHSKICTGDNTSWRHGKSRAYFGSKDALGKSPHRAFAYAQFCNGKAYRECWTSEKVTFSFSLMVEGLSLTLCSRLAQYWRLWRHLTTSDDCK